MAATKNAQWHRQWMTDMMEGVDLHCKASNMYVPHEPEPFTELTVGEDPEQEEVLETEAAEEDGYVDATFEKVPERKLDLYGVALRLSLSACFLTFVAIHMADPIWGTTAAGACGIWALAYGIRGVVK